MPDLSSKKLFYAGNIGKPQNLQSFIEYFQSKFPNEWSFDIFGAGEEFKNIYSQNYQNINLNSYIEREQLDKTTSQIPFALVSKIISEIYFSTWSSESCSGKKEDITEKEDVPEFIGKKIQSA